MLRAIFEISITVFAFGTLFGSPFVMIWLEYRDDQSRQSRAGGASVLRFPRAVPPIPAPDEGGE